MFRALFISTFLYLNIAPASSQVYNSWTWMNGDSAMNGHVVPGTQGVSSPSNYPGTRYEAVEWKDLNGKFWIFGGYETMTPYDHTDVWKYDPAINQWTWMSGSSSSGTVPSWGTKGIPSTSNTPGVRRLGPASWVDKNGKFWMFGGGNTSGSFFYNDMWMYDPLSNQWTWVTGTNTTNATGVYGTKGVFAPANTPGGRIETDCAVTDSQGKLWLFGGQGIDSTGFVWRHSNELWKFDPAINQWAFMGGNKMGDQKGVYGTKGTAAPTNWPGCRQIHLGWIDSQDNIWFWGGKGYDASGTINYLNDMWMYNTNTGMWTWMNGTNTSVAAPVGNYGTQCTPAPSNIPCQRIEARAHWTDNCNNLWMLGGAYYDGLIGQVDRNDLWRYNTTTNLWTWVSGDNTLNPTGVYGTRGVAGTANKPEAMEGANAFYVNGDGFWLVGGANWHDHGTGLFHPTLIYNHFEVWKYVPDKPSAAFSNTASSGCASLKVTFTDNSIPNCNEIKSRLWNFGDPASGTADTSSLANPVHTFSTAGTYQVKLIVYNCTLGKDSITKPVTVTGGGGGPTVALSSHTNPLCYGAATGAATVSASGGTSPYTYSWSPSGGTTATANGLSAGAYTCTVTDAGGCQQTQTVTLTTNPTLTLTCSSTPASCGTSSGSATATAGGGTGSYAYTWTPSGGISATATNLTAGTYTCTITDTYGCTISSTTTVTNSGGPTLVLSAQNNPLCFGNSTGSGTVNASGGTGPYTYSWTPSGGNTATATNLSAGNYTCTVTDAGGCIQTQVLTLSNPPLLTESIASSPACGLHNGSAAATGGGGTGTLTYSWAPAGGNASAANSLTTGTYTCTVTDANGCSKSSTVSVIADSIPAASAGTNVIISIGGNTMLQATGGGTYSWTPATALSCTTCANPTASPLSTTEYCVHVRNSGGCTDSSCVIITVDNTCGNVFVPNYFSPNGDGKNEQLCVYGTCIQTMTFAVYDRWGENVFTASTPGECWNGIFRGEKMNTGVFAYYLHATLLNGTTITQKGTVSLVR
ncbi:MAG: kelch repeat-containing protein [Bacteroidia bacterium]